MKLKYYFLFLALNILIIWGILMFITFSKGGIKFYVSQIIIVLSLIILIIFYNKAIKPLKIIAGGMELLQEQDFNSKLRLVDQYEADKIVQVFNRLMEKLKDERLRLNEQNYFLELLIGASPMGVIILDFEEKITMTNEVTLRFLNLPIKENITNKKLNEIESPLAHEIASLSNDSTKTIRLNDSMIYRCSKLSFMDRGFHHPFILIESLTHEIIKAEKKAYEKVIRMISHEVNNSVAGITSILDTVNDELEDIDNSVELREVMKICINRCFSMSKFITNFADVVKIPEPQIQDIRINDQIKACELFMENLCQNRNIKLILKLCNENPIIKIDTILFDQVLINIIKNSAESIEKDGNIIIYTSYLPTMIEIADNGKGINKDVEQKIFTPFFSTKPNGQGIGLLFIREILYKHNCTFSLRTYSDNWTRFRIIFN